MKLSFYPVILAGGRGTRFWPLSRRRRAKQLLALDGPRSMIQQTVRRLEPLAPRNRFWIITNDDLLKPIRQQVKRVPARQIIAEPFGRNTAPAIGLAAFILLARDPDAIIGMFPSDHVISDEKRFRAAVERAAAIAAEGENIVVMGIEPSRSETGYGYIEAGGAMPGGRLRVRRFTEKPDAITAREFLVAGNYFWNSGMFIWSARTLVNALREHLPSTAAVLEKIAATYGTRRFERTFAKLYSQAENISVDFAVLEPRSARGEGASGIYCLPADFGWNDLGSWTALHEHKSAARPMAAENGNVIEAAGELLLNAAGNYVHAPGKFVAAVGVKDVVVVETDDALLITTRQHSQDVARIVKQLDEKKKLRKLT
ncbi:MAG TPA: mannose-1-phosphate guanylyltransferase [Terriglobales bacterium]|nr:mannose-1-phosphate guanylyltransferase [Terriglobales bacterium]